MAVQQPIHDVWGHDAENFAGVREDEARRRVILAERAVRRERQDRAKAGLARLGQPPGTGGGYERGTGRRAHPDDVGMSQLRARLEGPLPTEGVDVVREPAAMTDLQIRTALRAHLRGQHPHATDLVVDELKLCAGRGRIDLAVVNGRLDGYEIKSGSDSLSRLAHQVETYSRVCDRVTVVADERHVAQLLRRLPSWWGLTHAACERGSLLFNELRPAADNPAVDPVGVAMLLWRNEALELLEQYGLDRGLRSKPRRDLWQALAERLPLELLGCEVRDRLRRRDGWRAAR